MFGTKILNLSFALDLVLAGVSCGKKSDNFSSEKSGNPKQQFFQVKGVIEEIKPDGTTATIMHEAIPDYMAAMTMDFEVKNTNELRGLKAGDAISFRLVVTDDDGWMDQVKKLNVQIGRASCRERVCCGV